MQIKKIFLIGSCILNFCFAQECTILGIDSHAKSLVAKLSSKIPITEGDVSYMLQTCEVKTVDGGNNISYESIYNSTSEPQEIRDLALLFEKIQHLTKKEHYTLSLIFNRTLEIIHEARRYQTASRNLKKQDTNDLDPFEELEELERSIIQNSSTNS